MRLLSRSAPGQPPGAGRLADPGASTRIRVITPEVRVAARIRDIWSYRELLGGLVRKELSVKYNASFLGMLWSMLNPAFTLFIYYFVFQVVLGSGIHDFAIYLMSGLLAYNLFSYANLTATGTMVGNAGIVKKVAFPREILPLASTGAGLVYFGFQGLVLIIVLLASRYHPAWSYLPLVVPALLALVTMSAALGVLLSAVNVYLRDTQHLVELIVGAAWFWSTPIVYSYMQISNKLVEHHLPGWLPLINPVTDIVLCFQRGIYGDVFGGNAHAAAASLRPGSALLKSSQLLPTAGQWWYLWHVLVVLGLAVLLLIGAVRVFGRLEGNFAEEL